MELFFSRSLLSSSSSSSPLLPLPSLLHAKIRSFRLHRPLATFPRSEFGWEDAFGVASDDGDRRDLRGFFQKVRNCNRGMEKRPEFVLSWWRVRLLGSSTGDKNDQHYLSSVKLLPNLASPKDRTTAVARVIKDLGNLIPGIRNELYPVTSSFSAPAYFSLERAAAPYFGIKAYGVHMNGYTEKNGQKFLWVGKRSNTKSTYPGMLDHLVAGGLPHGISCKENLLKECEEEAGIPRSISKSAIPVGAVTYMDIEGYSFKRDVLFCYDLKLPEGFSPESVDGEVDSFRLIPVSQVASIIAKTELFKPNCTLVIIDFLFRHGHIDPDCQGYLELLQCLRSGVCS